MLSPQRHTLLTKYSLLSALVLCLFVVPSAAEPPYPVGDAFLVNTYTPGNQGYADVAVGPADGFVIVWESDGIDASGEAVVMQRLDANATFVGGETRVNASSSGDQEDPAIAILDDGTFAVVWESDGQDGSGETVVGQVYDADGNAVGAELILNGTVAGEQRNPEVSVDGEGGFVAAWVGSVTVSDDDLYGRRFSATGALSGSEFVVRSTLGDESTVSIAGGTQGRFVVSWHSSTGDGAGSGVLAQRYNGVTVLKDGFESGDLSVWSSSVP